MALNPGRGAQVRLDGDAQKLARGGGAGRLDENAAAKAALERAGLSADGYSPDGSTVTGIIAEDEALAPGGVVPDIPTVTTIATNAANDAAVAQVNALAIPKTGGTMTGPLVLAGAATADLQPTTKLQLDTATLTLPTRASIATRTIPASVSTIYVLGYSTVTDGLDSGPWVRVGSSEPAHDGKIKDLSGAWFEYQAKIVSPKAFGIRATYSAIDESAAIQSLFNYCYAKYQGALGTQWVPQPVLEFGPGRYVAPGVKFYSDKSCVVVRGAGPSTLLDGIEMQMGGFRQHFENFTIMDSRGITAGTVGLTFVNTSRRFTTLRNVTVRDKEIGVWHKEGAVGNYQTLRIERCTIGFLGEGGGDSDFEDYNIQICRYGMILRGIAETKWGVGHCYGNDENLIIEGDVATNTVENYFTGITLSNLFVTRDYPVLRVEDNGSGGARAILWDNLSLSGWAAYTDVKFSRGDDWRVADCCIRANVATGTVDGILAGGTTQLISASISWTSFGDFVNKVVANINANTTAGLAHGYSAKAAPGNNLYIYAAGKLAGQSANGRTLTWTTSVGSIASGRPQMLITTAAPHGFVANDAVEFNTGTAGGQNGVGAVAWVESPTTFVVDGLPTTFVAGNVTKALRVFRDERLISSSGFTTRTTYNQSALFPAAVGPGWIDLGVASTQANIPFTGNDSSGTIKLQRWGIRIIGRDRGATVDDQFFKGDNVNHVLVSGAFQPSFVGLRTKDITWVDQVIFGMGGTNANEKIGLGFGRRASTARLQMPAGAATGWGYVGYYDLSVNITDPGEGGMALVSPYKAGGMLNGKSAINNHVFCKEDRISLSVGGTETAIGFAGVRFPGATFAELTSKFLSAANNGFTLRVTDRANRLVTSDGTAWRDANGTVLS